MTDLYDVIIVGGGPTGAALGIELGLNNIKTVILEKYGDPLLSPRAQFINARSAELLMRWDLAVKLKERNLFPKDYPAQGVWCSALNGVTYAVASPNTQSAGLSAQKAIRIPLWITEEVLRSKIAELASITFLTERTVDSVVLEKDDAHVTAFNKKTQAHEKYRAKYIIGCDGANSLVRQFLNIKFKGLAPKKRMINILFESPDLNKQITVEKGFLYHIKDNVMPIAMGPVDWNKGIWYAQIFYNGDKESIDDIDVGSLLEKSCGLSFQKKIMNVHFWDMQVQIADAFSVDNRAFLIGDSAHAFAITGGFGLNTALGDVTNFAWKLSAVIHKNAPVKLLETFEIERRPICLRNLELAEKNARDAVNLTKEFPPEKDPAAFAKANAALAKQHLLAAGLTLGYCYDPNEKPMSPSEYIPTTKPGYFLPHIMIGEKSIYEKLSPTHWTLIVCGKEKIKFQMNALKILHAPENAYPTRYILVRPDWHIALAMNTISESVLKQSVSEGESNNA